MLQRQKFAGFAHHGIQAVARAITGCVSNGSLQILDRHRKHQSAFHFATHFNRHNGGDIFISTVLGNPSNFATVSRHAFQRLLHRNMFIIQEHVFQFLFPVQAFASIFVAVLNICILAHPVNANRQLFHHNLVDGPTFQHGKMLLDRIFHSQQQAEQ